MRLLRFREVQSRVGFSRMHLYRLEKSGKFPIRVKIGANSVAWPENEIDRWIADKIAQRDAVATDASP